MATIRLPLLAISLSVSGVAVIATTVVASKEEPTKAEALYSPSTHYEVTDTSSEFTSYYSSISGTGSTMLSKLRSLDSSKKRTTFDYDNMGSNTNGGTNKFSSSPYIYTDFVNSTNTDSNGQPYSTTISSFYTGGSITSSGGYWNKEHVWPNSRGGNKVENNLLMPRPTLVSENSSRGNSSFVEGMNHSSNGWDPETAFSSSYYPGIRGECARIIFYCVVANTSLDLLDNANSSSTAIGKISDLIKWHYAELPTQREINRNNGAEYLQGNRNPFVDHPEYVSQIWGANDSSVPGNSSTIASYCTSHASTYSNWTPGSTGGSSSSTDPSASITASPSTSVQVGSTITLTAALSNVTSASNITWTSGNSNVTVTKGSTSTSQSVATVTASAAASNVTISCKNSGTVIGTINVSFTSGGSSGSGNSVTIAVSDIPSAYSGTSFTASGYSFGCSNINNTSTSGAMQWKSGSGYMYNTTAISGITSISMASYSGGSFTGTVYTGSSSHPTSGTSYSLSSGGSVTITGSPSYFTIQAGTVSGGAKCGDITVYYGSSSSSTPSATISGTTTVTVGNTTTLTAALSNVTNAGNISWSSSSTSIATVSQNSGSTTTSSSATITGVAAGTATIYVKHSGAIIGQTTVTVSAATTPTISISPSTASVTTGANTTLTATLTNVTSTSSIQWYSEDDTIATVAKGSTSTSSSAATVTGVAAGTAKIYCSYGTVSSYSTITVTSSGGSTTTPTSPATISYSDTFSPALPTAEASVNTSATAHTDTTSGIAFKEASVYKGSTNNYLMFVKNAGYLYNTSSLGTISSVAVTYSASTSTSGKVGVYFGNSEQSTYTTTSNATIAGVSQTDTFTNNTSGYGFFQVSTSNRNVQITTIVVTFTSSSSSTKTLSSISVSGQTTSFTVGDTFSFGGTVTATYSDSSTANVTSSATFSGYNMSTAGTQTVTVSYTEGGVTKTTTYSITVTSSGGSSTIPSSSYTFSSNTTEYNASPTFANVTNNFDSSVFTVASQSNIRVGSSGNSSSAYSKSDYMFYATSSADSVLSIYLNNTDYIISKVSITACKNISTETPTMSCGNLTTTVTDLSPKGTYNYYPLDAGFTITVSSARVFISQITISVIEASNEYLGWGQAFMEMTNDECSTQSLSTDTWANCNTIYTNNVDSSTKSTILSYTASNSGDYCAQAVARYDYIVAYYGTSTYSNFIGRNIASLSRINNPIFGTMNSETSTAIIVIASLVGLTSAFGLLMLKKRKED